jgi:hypothetical protein
MTLQGSLLVTDSMGRQGHSPLLCLSATGEEECLPTKSQFRVENVLSHRANRRRKSLLIQLVAYDMPVLDVYVLKQLAYLELRRLSSRYVGSAPSCV